MAYARLSIQVTPEEKTALGKRAKEHGQTVSEYCRDALNLYSGFDPEFWKRVEGRAKELNVPDHLLIQNTLIKRWAYDAAKINVYGSKDELLDEFIFTNQGIMTGEALFKRMYADFIGDLERSRSARLMAVEKTGKKLSARDKKWLAGYKERLNQYEKDQARIQAKFDEGLIGHLSIDETNETQEDIHKKYGK